MAELVLAIEGVAPKPNVLVEGAVAGVVELVLAAGPKVETELLAGAPNEKAVAGAALAVLAGMEVPMVVEGAALVLFADDSLEGFADPKLNAGIGVVVAEVPGAEVDTEVVAG